MISTETFNHDAAGNVTETNGDAFVYDTNNRLISFNGNAVSYDLDGNMLSNGVSDFTYDSANRLISASAHTYTYNAEDVRIRNICADEDTSYTYNTNCKLSQLLVKATNGVTTKYVYGRGLIGEETSGAFKTYHFDCRGSTIAITDASGNITDTFAYDTYGKLLSRTGYTDVIFGYNGRDGVVTDDNGLIYMRARYYSPDMKRFINADIVVGQITNAVTLNRFAYANGNPVSFVDPFGLSAERGGLSDEQYDRFMWLIRKVLTEAEKHEFNELEGTIDTGTIKLTASVGYSMGNSNVDLNEIAKQQIKLAATQEFENGTLTSTSDSSGVYSIEYVLKIDEFNTLSISAETDFINFNSDLDMKFSRQLEDKTSVYTTLGAEVDWKDSQNPPSDDDKSDYENNDMQDVADAVAIGFAVIATGVAIVAVAETIVTGGAGFWNDVPAITWVIGAWGNVLCRS